MIGPNLYQTLQARSLRSMSLPAGRTRQNDEHYKFEGSPTDEDVSGTKSKLVLMLFILIILCI